MSRCPHEPERDLAKPRPNRRRDRRTAGSAPHRPDQRGSPRTSRRSFSGRWSGPGCHPTLPIQSGPGPTPARHPQQPGHLPAAAWKPGCCDRVLQLRAGAATAGHHRPQQQGDLSQSAKPLGRRDRVLSDGAVQHARLRRDTEQSWNLPERSGTPRRGGRLFDTRHDLQSKARVCARQHLRDPRDIEPDRSPPQRPAHSARSGFLRPSRHPVLPRPDPPSRQGLRPSFRSDQTHPGGQHCEIPPELLLQRQRKDPGQGGSLRCGVRRFRAHERAAEGESGLHADRYEILSRGSQIPQRPA